MKQATRKAYPRPKNPTLARRVQRIVDRAGGRLQAAIRVGRTEWQVQDWLRVGRVPLNRLLDLTKHDPLALDLYVYGPERIVQSLEDRLEQARADFGPRTEVCAGIEASEFLG